MKYALLIFLIFLVIVRVLTSKPTYQNGKNLRITGKVVQEPSVYSYQQKITLLGLKIFLPKYPEIYYGDKITVQGIINNGELTNAELLKLETSNNFLIVFKKKIVSFWQITLPEPDASLTAGIVLGYKSALPKNFSDALKKTGTTHVVVASGMNVTFMATFLMLVLTQALTRRKAIILASIGILGYCVMTGFEAPVVRAAAMAGFMFAAQLTGRVAQAWKGLLVSGLLMLLVKPAWLTDIGFILSFAATTSLMLFEKKINSFIYFVPGLFRESLSTALAAQIGVAPILFITFGQFNILSPIINALVLWTVPLIMVFGSIGGVVGLVIPSLGQLVIYLVYPLTRWFINILSLLA